jgi:hypothetical protein
LKDPSTWKGFPRSGGYTSQKSFEREFPKIKAQRLREVEYRLELFKMHEEHRRDKVEGLDIEEMLRRVAEWCGADGDIFRGKASIVT